MPKIIFFKEQTTIPTTSRIIEIQESEKSEISEDKTILRLSRKVLELLNSNPLAFALKKII